jgi:hypothetical protein
MDALRQTLPWPWEAEETMDGSIVYLCPDQDGKDWHTSWQHPRPELDQAAYIKAVPVKDQPHAPCLVDFEALSYTWGDDTFGEDAIVVDGPADSPVATRLRLDSNLSTALRHLRHATNPRILWIDALCIDQANDTEKEKQLPRMADIYRHSRCVVVWLGPEADDSNLGMGELGFLASQVGLARDFSRFCDPDAQHKDWGNQMYDLPYSVRGWTAIEALISRSWFGRVWIMQEILVANRDAVVQCGDRLIPWNKFRRAVACLSVCRLSSTWVSEHN